MHTYPCTQQRRGAYNAFTMFLFFPLSSPLPAHPNRNELPRFPAAIGFRGRPKRGNGGLLARAYRFPADAPARATLARNPGERASATAAAVVFSEFTRSIEFHALIRPPSGAIVPDS